MRGAHAERRHRRPGGAGAARGPPDQGGGPAATTARPQAGRGRDKRPGQGLPRARAYRCRRSARRRGGGPGAASGGPTGGPDGDGARPRRRAGPRTPARTAGRAPPSKPAPHAAGHRYGAAGPLVREGEVCLGGIPGGGIERPRRPWEALHRGPLRLVRLSQSAFRRIADAFELRFS